MFTHENIWEAIDRLAATQGHSTSGLAKLAGLDPTSFNKSKRQSAEGKPRWPSTESLAKILTVTNLQITEFITYIETAPATADTALHIDTDAYAPLFQKGDVLHISENAPIRKNDRVVIQSAADEIIIGVFIEQDTHHILVIDREQKLSIEKKAIHSLARIMSVQY
jgi:phage repressor protein C with HTH and peptisase S24 domain